MLQWIHDRLSKVFWLIMAPLTIVFTLWGVHGVVDFTNRNDRVLKVNGEEVPLPRLREDYQRRMAELSRLYPDEVPAEVKKTTQDQIVEQFVNTAVMDQRVKAMRYAVSDQEVVESIKNYPAFQVDGKFNKDAYFALLQTRGYKPERFEAEQRSLLKTRALEMGLLISAFATPDEVKRSVALQNETREVATVLLPLSHFAAAVKAEPSAVKAYFEANKERFKTPDTVKLSYVSLKVENTAGAVDEASLKAYFETVKERYTEPEKRRARHILIQAGNDLEAARKKAEEVYGLATKPNADFAALAKQYSQDTGSAQQGGDLGLVEKSFFVGPFADAVFSMQVGEIKGPVKTPFGWHVIKLEQIEAGKAADFAKVKPELEKEYQKTEGERRFGERQEKLEQLAFESSGSLEPLAKALNLKIEEVPAFYEGLKDNELASNPKVLKAAFSADVLGGQNSRPIELAPGHVVVIRATDRKLPEVEPFEAVSSKVETLVKNEMAAKAAKAEAEKLAAAVSAGTALDVASKPLLATKAKEGEVKLAAARFIGRKDRTLAPDVIKAVFKAPAPTAGKPASGVVTLPNGDVEVYAVSVVKPGEVGNTASEAAEKAERVRGQGEFVTYLTTLRSKADVKFNPSVFE